MRGEIFLILIFILNEFSSGSSKVELSSYFWLDYDFPDDDRIRITMTSKSIGYLAIGFGPKMANSDMIMGRMVNDVATVVDLWCDKEHELPVEDSSNDVMDLSGSRITTLTSFTFT